MAAGRIARALTGAAVIAALLAGMALAQQRVVPPRASPLSGRPDTEGAMRLVPPVPPAQPTPVDKLPLAQLRLPRGFRIEAYAAGVAQARSLRVGDKGAVFAGSTLGFVYAVVSKDGRGEVKVVASGLNRPSGLAYKDDTLYIAELTRI
jgi:glucose/arabinose dehydrogenase